MRGALPEIRARDSRLGVAVAWDMAVYVTSMNPPVAGSSGGRFALEIGDGKGWRASLPFRNGDHCR
jgi:hypothetical protein